MKKALQERNRQFKEQELKTLFNQKEQLLYKFRSLKEDFLELKPVDKFITLAPEIAVFAMFDDEEVIALIQELEIGKGVTKYFVKADNIFESLDELSEKSKFLWAFETIWGFYSLHIKTFFNIQLSYDLGFDIKEISKKMRRQEKNGNLPVEFKKIYDVLHVFDNKIEQEEFEMKFPFFNESVIKSIKKDISFSHKFNFHNLYHVLLEFNEKVNGLSINLPDFKCDFYDLCEILLRDKSILNNSLDAQAKYGKPGSRRFKIKRIDSLFLKLS